MNSSKNSPKRTIYKVRISRVAEKDLQDIYFYIAQDKPVAAARFFHMLRQKALTLHRSPLRCAKIPERFESQYEYRHLLVKRYRIIFTIVDDTVRVLRIIHGARLLNIETLLYFFE